MNLNLDKAAAPPLAVSLTAEIQSVVSELACLSRVISMLDRRTLTLSLTHAKARQENLLYRVGRVGLECSGEDAGMRTQLLALRDAQRGLLHEAALLLHPDAWGTPAHPVASERVADFLLSRHRDHAHV